jgi:peptidoglycan-N-acetylglucosamine deacetylase
LKYLRTSIFIVFVAVIVIWSCTQKKAATVVKPVAIPDSTAIKQQQRATDSLAKIKSKKKKIYVTFDDGPNKGTRNVLNVVMEEKVPASFFIVGKHVFDSPEQEETFRQLKADSVIELCNHTYTHGLNRYARFYRHPAEVINDLHRNEARLSLNSKVSRMPGRNAWRIDTLDHTDIGESAAAIDSVHNAGFAVMGWDVEWMFDHKTLDLVTDTDLLLRQIENMLEAGKTRTPGNLVLLAHDQAFQKEADIEKLHYLFQQLKNNPDYELLLASNYPGVTSKKIIRSTVHPLQADKK